MMTNAMFSRRCVQGSDCSTCEAYSEECECERLWKYPDQCGGCPHISECGANLTAQRAFEMDVYTR
jgi:hypothetical protein